MTKYRIRLPGGRVIGPFLKEQLFELKAKGHITGKEEAQVYPTGNWGPITSLEFYNELIGASSAAAPVAAGAESTFVIDLTKLRQKNAVKEIDALIEESEPAAPVIEKVTETMKIEPAPSEERAAIQSPPIEERTPVQQSPLDDKTTIQPPPDDMIIEPQVEAKKDTNGDLDLSVGDLNFDISLDVPNNTVTSTAPDTPHITKKADRDAFEKAIDDEDRGNRTIVNPVAQQELAVLRKKLQAEEDARKAEEARLAEEEVRRKEAEALALQLREEEKDESTRVVNLTNAKLDLLKVAQEEEETFEKVAKEIKKKKAEQEAAEREAMGEDEDEEEEEAEAAKAKKKKLIIVAMLGLLAYAFLFPEEKPKKPPFKVLPTEVVFPVPFDKADSAAAKISFDKGKELYTKGTYPNIVAAGILFKTAYENDLEHRDSLNYLVRTYAEELKFSQEKTVDAVTVFNIIQGKRPFLIQDPNGAIGLNLFYMAIGKYEAAADSTAKYLKLFPKKVTQDLFAIYLKSLLKIGKLDVAKQIFAALMKAPDKNRYSYDAIIEYHKLNQEFDKVEEAIDEAIKRWPYLVSFHLMKGEMQLRNKQYKQLEVTLQKVEDLNLEYNDVYRAKFLELTGLLLASKGKVEKATEILNASLKLDDSIELRMRLADLAESNGEPTSATEKLIAESKAIKLLNQAKEFFEKRNYPLALSTAARASDTYPGHIPSDLFLAKVQLRLGLAEQALKTLEGLVQKYQDNKDVNFALAEAYIDTYKFNDAKNRIALIAGTDLKMTWEFASLNAKLYSKMGDTLQTVSWLKASMNANPLNDRDIFALAETFIKRNNFDAAQLLLNKCMELDPINPDYRIAYSKLIYEKQDDQAAVGYLLGLMNEFGENPKFLSEIAIMYYRAGKVKDFMAYKEKLSKLPNKDKALYDFLIRAALLDERFDEIPVLVEELLAIEPGELESMMTAGRVLFENGKLKEAATWFRRVQSKLSTYPKVQYYVAKIKLLAGEIDDPKGADEKPLLDEKGKPILGARNLILKDIKENGENDTSLVLLAEIMMKKDEIIEAETTLKKAQKINPRSFEALVLLADISTKRNNFDLALDLYKKAMGIKGDEPVLHRKMGDVYRLLGQGALAMESYKLYLEMNPDAPAEEKKQLEDYLSMMQ